MHRLRNALVLVPCLILPSAALAQSGSNNMSGASDPAIIIKYGDDEEQQTNVTRALRIGGPACEDDLKIVFEVDPRGNRSALQDKTLELWTANNQTSCSEPDNRESINGCSGTTCRHVTSTGTGTDKFEVTTSAKDLFAPEGGECPGNSVVRVALVFVSSTDSNCTSAANDTAEGKYFADFEVRTADAPEPSEVNARDGDASLNVSWSQGTGGRSTDTYVVLAVPADQLDGGGSCPPVFTGMEPPTTAEIEGIPGIVTQSASQTSATLSTNRLGLQYGDTVSVAVISQDLFGNRSVVSDASCATRIRTSGLVGAYESEAGSTIKTCSSTGVPGGDHGTAWIGLGVLLVGILGVRRARSAS